MGTSLLSHSTVSNETSSVHPARHQKRYSRRLGDMNEAIPKNTEFGNQCCLHPRWRASVEWTVTWEVMEMRRRRSSRVPNRRIQVRKGDRGSDSAENARTTGMDFSFSVRLEIRVCMYRSFGSPLKFLRDGGFVVPFLKYRECYHLC